MAQKFVHKVSPELIDDAQYKHPNEIPSAAMRAGSTVQLYPGTYAAVNTANLTNISLVGIGDKDDVVISTISVANTVTGTLHLKNLTVNAVNAVAAGGAAAITFTGNDNAVTLKADEIVVGSADIGIVHYGATPHIYLNRCDLSAADKAISSNCNVTIAFSRLNSSSNAYLTPLGAQDIAISVIASQSGGSNTGASTETINALLS